MKIWIWRITRCECSESELAKTKGNPDWVTFGRIGLIFIFSLEQLPFLTPIGVLSISTHSLLGGIETVKSGFTFAFLCFFDWCGVEDLITLFRTILGLTILLSPFDPSGFRFRRRLEGPAEIEIHLITMAYQSFVFNYISQ